MNVETFNATTAALVIMGGFVLACYTGIKMTETKHKAPERRPAKPAPAPVEKLAKPPAKPIEKSSKPRTSPETIEAMHKQADAERAIAEALEHRAQYITDPVKRARIEKQAVNSWLRFNQILDRIDKLTASD